MTKTKNGKRAGPGPSKKEILAAGKIILSVSLIMLVIGFFRLNMWGIILLFWFITLVSAGYDYARGRDVNIVKVAYDLLFIFCFVLVLMTLFHIGLWGVLIGIVLIVVWVFAKRGYMYMEALRNIETAIWGKPLDRKLWKKGELRKTRVRLVWKKRG